jgi:hypothetical protein
MQLDGLKKIVETQLSGERIKLATLDRNPPHNCFLVPPGKHY